jgi:large subunit ribosomal protein L9
MKVLLRRNVSNLGKIGEVVEVKPGYARNYLLPQRLGVAPTKANLKVVEAEKQKYLQEVAREREALELRAVAIRDKEVTITARANEEGLLYGSIGPAQIVAALAEGGVFLEPSHIVLDAAIRRVDKYDVLVRLAEDITATVHVWIVPLREAGAEAAGETPAGSAEAPAASAGEAPASQAPEGEGSVGASRE